MSEYVRVPTSLRVDHERRPAHRFVSVIGASNEDARDEELPALVYGFGEEAAIRERFEHDGGHVLGRAPLLVRPLRLAYAADRLHLPRAARSLLPKFPLLLPRRSRPGVREITTRDPRITRLWERFSVDVGIAVERDAAYVAQRVFAHSPMPYRVFIVEDGDRYAIRAMCIFRMPSRASVGHVMELLHDRSVDGMRAATHLLTLSLHEMSDAGADAAFAWSLASSGSYPIYLARAFLPFAPRDAEDAYLGVRAVDPALDDLVSRRALWYLSYLDDDAL